MILLLEIIAGWIGLGIVGPMLKRRFPKISANEAYLVSGTILTVLIVVLHLYANYQSYPRKLEGWQREILEASCAQLKTANSIAIGYAPTELEAEDYAQQIMSTFNSCNAKAAYENDPFPNDIVVNQKKVIVPPTENVFLRVTGLELWVEDPDRRPREALTLATALDKAGLQVVWKPDIRLGGIAVEGYNRYPVAELAPVFILVVGSKPAWSLSTDIFYVRRYLTFRVSELARECAAFLHFSVSDA